MSEDRGMGKVFLGRKLYWAIWALIVVVLISLGRQSYHVKEFNTFIFVLLGLALLAVLTILLTYRKGERVTREPFDEE